MLTADMPVEVGQIEEDLLSYKVNKKGRGLKDSVQCRVSFLKQNQMWD